MTSTDHKALEAALNTYVDKVDAALAARPPKRVDLAAADEALRRALTGAHGTETGDRLIDAGNAVAGIYARYLTSSGDANVAFSMAMDSCALVDAVDSVLDEATQTTVTAESDDVRRLIAEQKATVAALEAAIASADVEEVMRLRPELEVRLPVRIAEAKRDRVTRRLAALDASRARPARRAEQAAAAADAAEQTVRRLHAELLAAQWGAHRQSGGGPPCPFRGPRHRTIPRNPHHRTRPAARRAQARPGAAAAPTRRLTRTPGHGTRHDAGHARHQPDPRREPAVEHHGTRRRRPRPRRRRPVVVHRNERTPMTTLDEGRATYHRAHAKHVKAEDKQTDEQRFTFEALAGNPVLRGRARFLAERDPAIRQTLADVDAAYQAPADDPGDDAA